MKRIGTFTCKRHYAYFRDTEEWDLYAENGLLYFKNGEEYYRMSQLGNFGYEETGEKSTKIEGEKPEPHETYPINDTDLRSIPGWGIGINHSVDELC